MRLTLENGLVNNLVDHLERCTRGGIPSPEEAAILLRRLKSAVAESQRSPPPPEKE